MTMYEIRVTQTCRDYYRVHADNPKDAEAQLWSSLRAGKTDIKDGLTLVELNDTIAYVVQKMEPRRYGEIIRRAFDQLYAEGAESGTVMCIPTHNYQVSCPHRLRAFEDALEYITGHSDVWVTTGGEIAEYSLSHLQEQIGGGAVQST